jgi:small subunit ribosomal protein S16
VWTLYPTRVRRPETADLVPTWCGRSHHHHFRGDTTDVAVKIRLKRLGKIRVPQYRIVVVDSRKKRDGRVIEEIGKYHPKEDPSYIDVVSDRAQYWLGVGAQPSEAVEAIFKASGDWQKFKGEPAPAPLRVAEPKRDKQEVFNEALAEAHGSLKTEAVTAKKTAAKKTAEKKDDSAAEAKADETKVPEAAPEAAAETTPEAAPEAKADEAKADEAKAAEAPAASETAEA